MFILLPVMIAAAPVPPMLEAPVVWQQVGPNPRPMEPSALPIPRRRTVQEPPPAGTPAVAGAPAAAPAAAPKPTRYTLCLAAGERDLAAGIASARTWLAESQAGAAPNTARGAAAQCLGQLLLQQGDSPGAEAAFAESAEQVPAAEMSAAAALQAMAGNAALAGGRAETALMWFDKALSVAPGKAPTADENAARGAVQIDRSRALVALDRLPEASSALEDAHRLAPNDPEGWLLSATLARRGKDLERAQRDIEIAAGLELRGGALAPQIGLEAGVIAVLGGREAAARKSWESVLALGSESAEAKAARGYLDQLGPAPVQPVLPPETPR
jgi:tetratricopeptide (TPR) repeat protein